MEQSTGHPSNGGGKLEPEGTVWRGRGAAGEPPVELTAATGSRWRCRRSPCRHSAAGGSRRAPPFCPALASCSPEHPLRAVNVQILAAQVQSNGNDGPQGGRYFIYRPTPSLFRCPTTPVYCQARRLLQSSTCPRSPCPCVRLGGRLWRRRRHRVSRRACLRSV